MSLDKIDGQPVGPAQTISAAEQRRRLGLDAKPKAAKLPLTPAQARRAMSDDWIGDDLDPPRYERRVVSDPDAIAAAMGLRPEDFESAPLGSQPEGQPIAQARRPRIEPRTDTEHPSSPPTPKANEAESAAALSAATVEARRLLNEARASGNADAETVRAGMRLAERIARGVARLKS